MISILSQSSPATPNDASPFPDVIDNSPLRKSVSVMGDAGAYVVSRLVTREMGMRLRPFKGEKEKKF